MLYFLGRAALRLGDVERAAACYLESLSLAREQGDRSFIPFNLIGLAAVARARGRLLRAGRLLGAAAGMLTSFPVLLAPPDRRSHDRLVEAVRAAVGEERFAQEWSTGAALTLDQAVADALQQNEERPAAARDAASSRGPLLPDRLTTREAEVLVGIAAGKSNREIAAELVISTRTVVHHVEHIYRKIAARNRADAAAYAIRQGLAGGAPPPV